MKRTCFIIVTALLVTLFTVNISFALRWRNGLVSVGDSKTKVQSTCGEPDDEETIGYTEVKYKGKIKGKKLIIKPKKGSKRRAIVAWTYRQMSGGRYYILTFTGSKLTEINSVRK